MWCLLEQWTLQSIYIPRPFKGPSPPKQKIIVFSVLYLLIKLDDVFFSKWLTKEILDVSYYDWSA